MMIHYIAKENIFIVITYNFSIKKNLKCHFKDFFKINDEQTIKMPKKEE